MPLHLVHHIDSRNIIFLQMDVVCERCRVLTDFSNMQKVKLVKVNMSYC
jgi:hypothetical protein